MKKFNCKVIPLYKKTKKETCCVCYQEQNKYVKCNNSKCTDGIICLACLKNMSDEQRNICQICRINTDVFKEKKIEIVTNIEPQTFHLTTIKKKGCCKKCICCKNFYKGKLTSQMQIMLLLFVYVIICSMVAYAVGFIFLLIIMGTDKDAASVSPILTILLGTIISFCFAYCCGVCHACNNMNKMASRNT